MDLQCPKCLTSRTGDELGAPCRTAGCDGVIAEAPRYRDRVDVLPEPMTCGRRMDDTAGADRWHKFKAIDNRVCSYCGSLHPDDMFRLVKECGEADAAAAYGTVPEIEPSDKGYKIYVRQPGVRNALEGGIKFYTHHIPADMPPARNDEFKAAVAATRKRFAATFRSPKS